MTLTLLGICFVGMSIYLPYTRAISSNSGMVGPPGTSTPDSGFDSGFSNGFGD